jgi:hypothetical protein
MEFERFIMHDLPWQNRSIERIEFSGTFIPRSMIKLINKVSKRSPEVGGPASTKESKAGMFTSRVSGASAIPAEAAPAFPSLVLIHLLSISTRSLIIAEYELTQDV